MLAPSLVRTDMRYWRLRPDVRLLPWVHCYFIVKDTSAGRDGAAIQTPELLLPDGHSEIVFSFDAAFERWRVESQERTVMQSSYVIGGRSHSVLTHNLGPLRLVGVKLDSRFLHLLIRAPLTQFSDSTVTLHDLQHRGLLELDDALATLGSVAAIVRRLDGFFLDVRYGLSHRATSTDALLQTIVRERGNLSIMDWAREHRIDARTLERRFSERTGMTPKRFARVVRFKHAYHRLTAGSSACGDPLDGFYDQSHFHREFRHFTGAAPAERLRGRMQHGTCVTDHLIEGEFSGHARE